MEECPAGGGKKAGVVERFQNDFSGAKKKD
jgi:hypothetical protein